MTEDEAKIALFELNKEYMSHTKKERLKLYDEYKKNRSAIKEALIKHVNELKLKKWIIIRYSFLFTFLTITDIIVVLNF